MSETDLNRREFLQTSIKTAAGAAAMSGITFLARPEKVFGANDRVRVAVCGLHGRGKDHIENFSHVPNVEIAALCDVDEEVLNKRRGEVSGGPKTLVDVRKLLEDKSIDAISIATPNHWHSLMANLGLSGGEGCICGEAPLAQLPGRSPTSSSGLEVQPHGPARNSDSFITRPARSDRRAPDGPLIGDVYLARGLCFKHRDTIRTCAGGSGSSRSSLRSVDRACATETVHAKPLSLQLALDLGHRRWRPRQSGNSSGRLGPLGTRAEVPDAHFSHRRSFHV